VGKERQEAGWMLGSLQKKDKSLVKTWKEMCIAQGQNPTDVLLGIMRFQVNSGGIPEDIIVQQKIADRTEQARTTTGETLTIAQLADQMKQLYIAQTMQNIQQIRDIVQQLQPIQPVPAIEPLMPQKKQKPVFSQKELKRLMQSIIRQSMQQSVETQPKPSAPAKTQPTKTSNVEADIKAELLGKKPK